MNDKCEEKEKKPKKANSPKFIKGRHLLINDGFGYNKEGKTNGRFNKMGVDCVMFERQKQNGTVRPAQNTEVLRRKPKVSCLNKGKVIVSVSDQAFAHTKGSYPQKKIVHKQVVARYIAKDKGDQLFKAHASHDKHESIYILRVNNLGKGVARYVVKQPILSVKRQIWV
jgi:hypothetical protein